MTVKVTSERLTLRELTPDDAEFVFNLYNSPEFLQFIGDKQLHSRETAKLYIENVQIPQYQNPGIGMWAIELKESQKVIGVCGLVNREEIDGFDIGYALLKPFTGKGYASEAVDVVMKWAKTVRNMQEIFAVVQKDNAMSIRLLENKDFHRINERRLSNGDLVQVYVKNLDL